MHTKTYPHTALSHLSEADYVWMAQFHVIDDFTLHVLVDILRGGAGERVSCRSGSRTPAASQCALPGAPDDGLRRQ